MTPAALKALADVVLAAALEYGEATEEQSPFATTGPIKIRTHPTEGALNAGARLRLAAKAYWKAERELEAARRTEPGSEPSRAEIESWTPHRLLHVLWTKAVGTPTYVKSEWRRLEKLLLYPGE